MDFSRPSTPISSAHLNARLVAFGLAGIVAVYLGFLGVSVAHAESFIKYAGYYVLAATFVLWSWSLWSLWRTRRAVVQGLPRWERITAILLVVLFTAVAIAQETFRSKILNDEFVLQSTAFGMHFFREIAAMARGYDILGTFISTDTFLDKRPNFYPFLVSLVHDFTGYRTTNAFYLNSVLMAVTLGLAYIHGRKMSGWRGGMLAVALLGSLPVFAQNATGSGMEMLNLTMLLAVIALAAAYLDAPNEIRLSAFLLATVLMAQCRYESVLYVAPSAVVVLIGWWRARRIIMSWVDVSVPLLLIPVALHNKVLSESPVLWEMKENQTSRFGVEYVMGNLRGAANFLFTLDQHAANSLVLALVGTAGLVWVMIGLWRSRMALRDLAPHRQVWLFFGVGILLNTTLVMFYFWSSFLDPMAARFSLPLYLLMVFAGVQMSSWFDRWIPATVALLGVTGVCFLGFSVPKQAAHHYSHLGIDEIEWEQRFVAARPPGDRIILANNSTINWLLRKTPSILLNRARRVADRLQYQLEAGAFREILVLQSLRPTTIEGDHEIVLEDRLPASFHLELLAEKRFGTKLVRISRLVAVDAHKESTPNE